MYQNMCNSSVSDLKSLSLCWWRLVAWCTKINLLPFFKVKIVVLKEGIIGWYLRSQTPLFTNKSTKTIFKHILLSFTNVASIYEHAHTWIVIVILTTTNAAHRSTWDARRTKHRTRRLAPHSATPQFSRICCPLTLFVLDTQVLILLFFCDFIKIIPYYCSQKGTLYVKVVDPKCITAETKR